MEVNQEGNILTIFEQLVDPRMDRTKLHLLEDIVMLTIMAVICGADSYTEIYEFGIAKEVWLKTFLKLANGIPSHDTIGRVMNSIYPEEFEHCFIQWVLKSVNLTEGELVSIDGKTLRRSYNKQDDKAAIHMVSAWANKNRMVLGQIKTEEKSNEITAIPELLKKLVIKGCIVTIDAMGCQKEIAQAIRDTGADYLLQVKGNQPTLLARLKALPWKDVPAGHTSTGRGHGRIGEVGQLDVFAGRRAGRFPGAKENQCGARQQGGCERPHGDPPVPGRRCAPSGRYGSFFSSFQK